MNHSIYDQRHYPIVDVREGYGEWVHTYEQTVLDEMDLRLLQRLQSVDWGALQSILDLACGTGRIGAWLRSRSNAVIEGVFNRWRTNIYRTCNRFTKKQHA